MEHPFKVTKSYKRSILHDNFGGNRQSGIAPCAKYPYIFVFSGSSGQEHGYKDQWVNPHVYSYTGEGQVGDMEFTKGNLHLRDHIRNGKRVFLFHKIPNKKSWVEFVAELHVFDCDFFQTHDRNNQMRTGIKFFFKRANANLYAIPDELNTLVNEPNEIQAYKTLKPTITERTGLVTTRIGQGAYRKSVLHRWQYKCAVTQFADPRILIASHIIPWRDSTDEQRLDVDNGILLSPDFDALFDRHLVSFDESGKILISGQMKGVQLDQLGISGSEKISKLSEGNLRYLEEHRQLIA